ncbi:hypothetical protein EWM64_g2366 [Hericium alpestre]|uniref:Uncharacterized protein n=1 Tax=Hericium alpestre TaxID=135208 RepID=A0A4Z0A5I5_9AGAM|nr:hypothetical protein EWM64_g2366 [Hericium alpestre]
MTEVVVADSELSSSSATFDSTNEATLPSWTRRWAWTGNFANVSSSSALASSNNSQAQETTSRKDHLVRITGDLLYPITADSQPTSILPAEARGILDAKQVDQTWAVNHDDYAELVNMLYGAADPMELLTKLTKYGDSDALPYQDEAVPAFWKYAMYDHIRVNHPRHWNTLKHAPQGLDHELNAKLILSSDEFSRIVKDQVFTIPPSDTSVSLPFAGCEMMPAPAIAPAKRKAPSRPRKNSNTSATSKRPKSSVK